MNSCELVTFVSSIACALFQCCNKEDLPVMAAIFTQLGDSLATMLAHEEACGDKESELTGSIPPQASEDSSDIALGQD